MPRTACGWVARACGLSSRQPSNKIDPKALRSACSSRQVSALCGRQHAIANLEDDIADAAHDHCRWPFLPRVGGPGREAHVFPRWIDCSSTLASPGAWVQRAQTLCARDEIDRVAVATS